MTIEPGVGAYQCAGQKNQKDPAGAALLRGLRMGGKEAQLTRAIAAVCEADGDFCRALLDLILGQVPEHCRAERFRRDIPADLGCAPEVTLFDPTGTDLGRVDLLFSGTSFKLLVELKLYAGYGNEQVHRYLRWREAQSRETRFGLAAITRGFPTYGEEAAEGDPGWLGSIRWATILGDLRALEVTDSDLAKQWLWFIDVLEEDGDMGLTRLDDDRKALVWGWSKYLEGRTILEDLMSDLWEPALERLRSTLADRPFAERFAPNELASVSKRGNVVVVRSQSSVRVHFAAPPGPDEPDRLWIQFLGLFGKPHFTVEARRPGGPQLLSCGHEKFRQATEFLRQCGFKTDERRPVYWSRVHEPGEYLDVSDVPAKLKEIIELDIHDVVASGILDADAGLEADREVPVSDYEIEADQS